MFCITKIQLWAILFRANQLGIYSFIDNITFHLKLLVIIYDLSSSLHSSGSSMLLSLSMLPNSSSAGAFSPNKANAWTCWNLSRYPLSLEWFFSNILNLIQIFSNILTITSCEWVPLTRQMARQPLLRSSVPMYRWMVTPMKLLLLVVHKSAVAHTWSTLSMHFYQSLFVVFVTQFNNILVEFATSCLWFRVISQQKLPEFHSGSLM